METQQCNKCKEVFPASIEHFRPKRKICRACDRAAAKAYGQTPEHKARTQTPEWKAKEQARNKARRQTPEYKAHEKAYQQKRRQTPQGSASYKARQKRYWNSSKGTAYKKCYRQKPERKTKERDYEKAYRERPDYRNRQQAYMQTDAYKISQRLGSARRRARKYELPDTFTRTEWKRALEYFHGVCAYCDNPPSFLDRRWVLHAEHFVPISSADCPGTVKENMIPACQSCNLSKNDTDPREWLTERFGQRKAKQILKRIEDYFASLR